jgi:alkylhydroperoxidase family enzyme
VARIDFPDRGFGEHVDWSLTRPKMAAGMGALSEAVYTHSRLAVREREAARWTIALINDCVVCQDTRPRDSADVGVDEGFYGEVAGWRTSEALSERERLAAEFDEIADLTMCCGMFLGLGRALAVVGVPAPDDRILI